jgi:hypothetical protein
MSFTLTISVEVILENGTSTVFVGANGSGKSRLAIHIEDHFGKSAHRISAHRALTLNPDVPKVKEEQALVNRKSMHASVRSPMKFWGWRISPKPWIQSYGDIACVESTAF